MFSSKGDIMGYMTSAFMVESGKVVRETMAALREALVTVEGRVWFKEKPSLTLCVISIKPPLPLWTLLLLLCGLGVICFVFSWPFVFLFGSLPLLWGIYHLSPIYIKRKAAKTLKRKGYKGTIQTVPLTDIMVLWHG